MTTTEIKKELYKQKPSANLLYIRKGIAYYESTINVQETPKFIYKTLLFEIPVIDMGDSDFNAIMDAKLLIRWMVDIDKGLILK